MTDLRERVTRAIRSWTLTDETAGHIADAAIAEVLAWRPMSEAPRDGSEIDLRSPSVGRVTNSYWWEGHWYFRRPTWDRTGLLPMGRWGESLLPDDVSHWMPPPPPPETPEGGEG